MGEQATAFEADNVDRFEPNGNSSLATNIGMRHQVGDYLRKYLAELIDFKLSNVIVSRK